MGREIVLFSSEEHKTRPQVVTFLREIADRIEGGEVTLKQGNDSVTLSIPHNLVLELKAETENKKGREKQTLEIEIEWYEGEEADKGVTLS